MVNILKYCVFINYLLTNIVLYIISRAVLQILLQGITLKPLKMLMAKLYLPEGWSRGGAAHPIRAGVGVGNAYHQKVNKSLKLLNIFFTKNFQSSNFVQKIKALYV